MFLVLLLTHAKHQEAFAVRPLFLVETPGPSDNWTLDHNLFYYWPYSHITSYNYYTSDHRSLVHIGEPVSITECKQGAYFPSPGIASVSYFGNGTNFNSTFWLTRPFSGPETYENDSRIYQVYYAINALPLYDKTPQQINDTVTNIRNIILDPAFHSPHYYFNESSSTTVAGNPAYKLVYTYSYLHPHSAIPVLPYPGMPSCKLCKAMKIFIVKNNRLYYISYFGDMEKYREFWPTVQGMINSTKIGRGFLEPSTYENTHYRVLIHYPPGWTLDGHDPSKVTPYNIIVKFNLLKDTSRSYHERIIMLVDNFAAQYLGQNLNLMNYLDKRIEYLNATHTTFHFDRKNVNGTDYYLEYSFISNGTLVKAHEEGTVVGNDKVNLFVYAAEASRFDLDLLRSLVINPYVSTLTYNSTMLGLTMGYPYNWAIQSPIIGPYSGAGAEFFSPVDGPISIAQGYTMLINYHSPYSNSWPKFPPYRVKIQWNGTSQTWYKTIEEWSSLGGQSRILVSVPVTEKAQSSGFFKEGYSYALLNFDLSSLNLPERFIVSFMKYDYFLLNGQYCDLSQQTQWTSVPLPNLSISYSPAINSLNLTPGDEKQVHIQAQSSEPNIASRVFFYTRQTEQPGTLQLTLNPSQTFIDPSGMATSTLDVHVPQGATAPKSYGVEITANLQQIPPTSLNNSQIVSITKYSNLTVPVSPQPPWPVQVSDFWSKVGPLLTALSVGLAWIIKEIISTRRKKTPPAAQGDGPRQQ
jgi:hypothetical protein